jgi:hypothetical protein
MTATLTIADLEDPDVYEVKRGVPIFRAHTRKVKAPDGVESTIVVTDDDLPTIVANMTAAQIKEGVFGRIVDGHIKPAADAPEKDQPALIGFQANARLGRLPSGAKCIVADHFIRRDKLALAKERPFRSAEYYPGAKTITGTALLLRDPYLDLGTVTYMAERGLYLYLMEALPMADAAAMPQDDDWTPEEVRQYERCMRYMAKKGVINYADAAGPGAPAANNTGLPAEVPAKKKEHDKPVEHARDAHVAQPALYAKLEAAEKRIADLIAEQERQKCAGIVAGLKDAGARRRGPPRSPRSQRRRQHQRHLAAIGRWRHGADRSGFGEWGTLIKRDEG